MLPAAVEAVTTQLVTTGNPSSLHASGRHARRVVEESRETIAQALNCRPGEVVFTSGGTESDNLALKGLYWARRSADAGRRRILATSVEHHAVLDPLDWLAEHEGAVVELLPVDRAGRLDLAALREAIERDPGSVAAHLGDVGQQRGRDAAAGRRGRGHRRRARHPRPHRRRAGGGLGARRLRRLRRRRADADRAQGRRALRRRRAGDPPRGRGDPARARRGPGARHPLRHHRHPRDRGLRRGRRAGRQAAGRARRAGRGAARRPGPPGPGGRPRRPPQRRPRAPSFPATPT